MGALLLGFVLRQAGYVGGVALVQGLIWWRGSVNGVDCGNLLWRFEAG